MESHSPHCVQCKQSIFSPVCENCYINHVKIWLNEYSIDPNVANHLITSLINNIDPICSEDSRCVLCNNEFLSVCAYCFFFKIERILKSLPLTEESRNSFLNIFNHKLYHQESLWL